MKFIQVFAVLTLTVFTSACNSSSKVGELDSNELDQAFSDSGEEKAPVRYASGMYGPFEEQHQVANYLVEIFEDSKGHLWFGTMDFGVARFDGEDLTYFTTEDGLCGMTISSVTEDNEGNIWLGSHTGLCKYDGESFEIIWTTSGRHDEGDGWVSVTRDNDGTIWAANSLGIYRQEGDAFVPFELPIASEEITSYSITKGRGSLRLHDSKGNYWFGVDGYGAIKYDGESFTRLSQEDGLCSNNISSILEDKNGNIWFTSIQSYQPEMTGDGGLCMYDGKTFKKFTEQPGLSQNDLYTVYEDKDGILWIGATGHGVYQYDGETFTFIDKTNRMDLTSGFGLQSMLHDSRGALWFGFSGGLFTSQHNGDIVNVVRNAVGC